MTTQSQLIGYVRKSKNGGALMLSIDTTAFSKAERYSSADGREFVSLIANLDKVRDILEDEREVTSLCQLVDGE